MAQWLTTPTRNHKVGVRSLALLNGLRIQYCRELWCRLQTRLGSAPIRPLAWEPPYAAEAAQRNSKKKKELEVVSMRIQVQSLASLSGSGIQPSLELWCRSQTWLGSCVAVAVV